MSGGVTRRSFVGAGVALGALAVAPPVWAVGNQAILKVDRSQWERLVGQRLRLSGHGIVLTVVLAEVTELRPTRFVGDPERYALELRGRKDAPRLSGIHRLYHRDLGRLDLFVSAVGRTIKASHFEAIIDTRANPARS